MVTKKWVVVGIDEVTRRKLEQLCVRKRVDQPMGGRVVTMTSLLRDVLRLGMQAVEASFEPLPYGALVSVHEDGSYTPILIQDEFQRDLGGPTCVLAGNAIPLRKVRAK